MSFFVNLFIKEWLLLAFCNRKKNFSEKSNKNAFKMKEEKEFQFFKSLKILLLNF